MNPQTTKEIRTIAPFFALAALAPVLTMPLVAVWSRDTTIELGLWLSVIAGVAMSAMPFGDEFINRTMGLLLTQPLSRSRIWRGKMLVLGAAAAVCFFAVGLRIFIFLGCYVRWPTFFGLALLLFCVAGVFCTTPFWTLCIKNPLGTVAATLITPVVLGSITNLLMVRYFRQWSWESDAHMALITRPESFVMLFILIVYFAFCFWFARRMFLRLEVIDSPGREIALPDRLQPLFAPLWQALTPGHGSALRSLITKELYLQRVCFGVAVIFCAVFFVGAASWSLSKSEDARKLATVVMITSLVVCSMLISFIAGGACVADERNWGMLGWHLVLPPSKQLQWIVKVAVAMGTSLILGICVPLAFYSVCKPLFHLPPDIFGGLDSPLKERGGWPALLLMYSLLIGITIYTSSLTYSALRATVGAIVLIFAGEMVVSTAGFMGQRLAELSPLYRSMMFRGPVSYATVIGDPAIFVIAAIVALLAVLIYLGFTNFRAAELTLRRKWMQPAVLLLGIGIIFFFLSFLSNEPAG